MNELEAYAGFDSLDRTSMAESVRISYLLTLPLEELIPPTE